MSRCVGNLTTGSSESTPLNCCGCWLAPLMSCELFFSFFWDQPEGYHRSPLFIGAYPAATDRKRTKTATGSRTTNRSRGEGGLQTKQKKVKRVKSLFLCVCAKSKKQKRRSREVQGRWFCCKRYKMAASKRCHFYLFFPPNFSGFNLNSFNNNKKRRVWCPVGQTIIINHEFLFTFSRWMVFF